MTDSLKQLEADMRERAFVHNGPIANDIVKWADRLAALATPTAREPVKVTAEMIEAACLAYIEWFYEGCSADAERKIPCNSIAMRAALTAALGQQDGKSGSESGQKADSERLT